MKYYNWIKSIDEKELNEVIEILKNDGIIIFPTETVYGIGGNALSNEVIDRVYEAKKRPREKAVNIMVSNINEIKKYADITCELEQKIIEKCMPGPITLILKKKPFMIFCLTFATDIILNMAQIKKLTVLW